MTDPLDILFENLLEHLDENLPGTCWPLYQRESRLENALLASLTPEQIELLESYQAAAWRCTEQEERFLFRSGFRLARELGVENLVLYHTEDKNLPRRKELYTREGREFFAGGLYIPDDLERIQL